MNVVKRLTAGILTGILTMAAIAEPAKAAVYEQEQAAEILSSNQMEESVGGSENLLQIPEKGDEISSDHFLEEDTKEDSGEISGNGMAEQMPNSGILQKEDGEDPESTPSEEKSRRNPETDPNMANMDEGTEIDLSNQEELDRALAEGLVDFQPNEEISEETEPRAKVAGGDLVMTASREVGVSGRPNKYTYWLGSIGGTYAYAWCHAFVSWCGAQAGASAQIPKTASCYYGAQEFKARGQWQNRISGYVPKSGDIIYFDWNANGSYDHVGIVNYVSAGRVHTIEGNAGDAVRIDGGRTGGYALTDSQIIGYGVPDYNSDAILQACVDSVTGGTGVVQVRGWAFDRSSLTQALNIKVYVGGPADSGAPVYTVKADQERKDVDAVYPGVGISHGFDETIYVNVSGNQQVYVYACYAAQGIPDMLIGYWTANITADTKKPTVKNVKVSDISAEGYKVTCKVSDNVGIDRVMFPSWHDSKTGDQAVWFEGTVTDGAAECFIPIEQLGNLSGVYTTHVYAYDMAGNFGLAAAKEVAIDLTSLKFYTEQNLSTDFDALIESESSKKVLAVQDTGLGAADRTEDMAGQMWVFRRVSTGSYSIQSKTDGRYLAVSSEEDGAELMLSQDEPVQLWNACWAGEDTYYLKPAGSGACVMAENGSYTLKSFAAASEQRFKIRKLSTNVKKISLDPAELDFTEIGQTQVITASIEPQSAADEKILWQSSDEKTASVDKKGKVTAVGNGTADITASTEDGSLRVICKVTVCVKVTGISLSKQEIKLTSKGAVKKLSAAVAPANAYNKKITWSSSNKKAASVDQTGKVTAVADGTAEITAQSADGEQKAICNVTVQIPQVGAGGIVKSGKYTYSADFIKNSSAYKTVIYRQQSNGSKTKLAQISAKAYIKLVYGGKLYYEKVTAAGKRDLCAMNTKTFAQKTVYANGTIAGHYKKRFLIMPYSAKTKPKTCHVLNVSTGKSVLISKKCLGAAITGSKIYYVEAVSGKTSKGWKARGHSCTWTGAKDKYVTGKITVLTCEKVTAKYVIYQTGKSRYQYKYAGKKKTKL